MISAPVLPLSSLAAAATQPLVLEAVTLHLGGRRLLGPLDARIAPGECLSVMGPSGCGKSTLLRGLSGQQPLKGGTISMLGKALAQMSADERRRIGYVPQDDVELFVNELGAPIIELDKFKIKKVRSKQFSKRQIFPKNAHC